MKKLLALLTALLLGFAPGLTGQSRGADIPSPAKGFIPFNTNQANGSARTDGQVVAWSNALGKWIATNAGSGSGDVTGGSASASGELAAYSSTTGKAIARSYLKWAGLATTVRTKTVRDADDTLLELGGSYTPTGTWNFTSLTGTWPTFNQNTTGSAVYWKTSGTGKAAITGPSTDNTRTFTFPDADSTMLYAGGALGTPSGGTMTNCLLSNLAAKATPVDADLFMLGDSAAAGVSKYVTGANLKAYMGGSSMVYPGVGVPNSTGSAWGASYTVGTGANNLVQLNSSSQLPAVDGSLLTNIAAIDSTKLPLTGGTLTGTLTESQSIINTLTDGIVLTNPTAAISGTTVQRSPANRWHSSSWNTTTAAANTYDWVMDSLPTTGTGNSAKGNLTSRYSLNGGAYKDVFTQEVRSYLSYPSNTGYSFTVGDTAALVTPGNLGTPETSFTIAGDSISAYGAATLNFISRTGNAGRIKFWSGGSYIFSMGTISVDVASPGAAQKGSLTVNLGTDGYGDNQNVLSLMSSGAIQGLVTSNGPVGTFTATAGNTTVVSNTSVTANSKVFPTPTNAAAATLLAGGYYKSAQSAGTSFTLTFTLTAVGTETFDYLMLN